MISLISGFAAILILGTYLGMKSGVLDPHGALYDGLNLLASLTLAGVGAYHQDWGLIALNVSWAGITLASWINRRRAHD